MHTNIGENIIYLLFINKMSQKELASKTGLTESAISHYVTGDRNPTINNLIKIAQAFGVTVDFLLSDAGTKKKPLDKGEIRIKSKVMLILEEIPTSCDKCPVHSINVLGDICCRKKDGAICRSEKPTWCPLRDVPKKKDLEELRKYTLGADYIYAEGFNACIDEILRAADAP